MSDIDLMIHILEKLPKDKRIFMVQSYIAQHGPIPDEHRANLIRILGSSNNIQVSDEAQKP